MGTGEVDEGKATEDAEDLSSLLRGLALEVERQGTLLERIAQRLELPVEGPPPSVPPAESWRGLGLEEGERRTVSVLFADLCGFTTLAEHLDAEEAGLVLRDVMTELARIVVDQGGHVEKFIGDALCAVFGAPVAYEDEPERAARSALAMHALLAGRGTTRADLPPLALHAGINTGTVVAGGVGDGSQFGVTGDTINTAHRLMDLASTGQTFCSAATAARLRRHFRLEDVGTVPVKGRTEPVEVHDLVRELDAEEVAAARRPPAPLLGRDAELAELLAAVDGRAVPGREVVVVSGEAGSGKSRLLHELGEAVADRATVLRASAKLAGTVPLGYLGDALEPVVRGLAPGRTLAEVLADRATDRPLLVLLDDVSAADPASADLLRSLLPATAGTGVVWVAADRSRTAALAALTEPGVEAPALRSLRLAPLDPTASAALLAALLPGAFPATPEGASGVSGPAEEACRALAARTGGNPEFAEELVAALIEGGQVVEEGGRFRSLVDLCELELPGSVAELVESRLSGLSSAARTVLQDASVIGVRFTVELLRRSTTLPLRVDDALAELTEAGLVDPPSEPGPMRFWSVRSRSVRDVAYESLLKRRRPAAHARVAEGLLAITAEPDLEVNELLAHHFALAGDPRRAAAHLTLAEPGTRR